MFKKGNICQSCSMPLNKDPQGGGTEKDGSKNTEYCSLCYKKGAFIQPNMTVTEMQVLVKGKLQDMHFPGFLASLFTKNIPQLKRWKTS